MRLIIKFVFKKLTMAPRGLSAVTEVRESLDRQFHNDVNRLTYSKVSFLPIHKPTSSILFKRCSMHQFWHLVTRISCNQHSIVPFSVSHGKSQTCAWCGRSTQKGFLTTTTTKQWRSSLSTSWSRPLLQGYVQKRARHPGAQVRAARIDE